MSKVHNFSAGPCILPPEVLKEASEAVKSWGNNGLSLIEMSHRSKPFVAVMEETRSLTKELLNLPDRFEILYLQGGASLGFLTSAYNLIPEGGSAAYVDTGAWANKAVKEAKHLGDIEVVASAKERGYVSIPKINTVDSKHSYLHYTTNNTIYGTQFKKPPTSAGVPLVADMSSDIMSKEFDSSAFQLIYAGAQKNMGPAGTVMYAIDKNVLGKTGRDIPAYLDLGVHISKDSMFNTPPVFSIFTTLLTLKWLKAKGGVAGIEKINNAKAELIYNEIDRNPLFRGHAEESCRSTMNATFMFNDPRHTDAFDAVWAAEGISGIKGHRSVGGYRASMYNALPIESVQVLVDVMKDFERKI
jgi:phosphoserine aminotransferase|tara:strand:- start:3684 stop:4757 length:1074 start_codon:yes stop_codon:yes gene_type:complete